MDVKLVGMDKLQAKLEYCGNNREPVKTVITKNGNQLNAKMKSKMTQAYIKGYSHGDTAGSVNTVITDGGMTANVGPTTDYSPYVEYGTRFMQAEPAVKPAFEEQVPIFKRDMEAIMK
ncbi:MAG: HK97 gp10 family phage protein [Lachnospiraceae bacterium]|nr:HK97 gp10 family phage protein [Lachnospiraceae bacterium]